MKAHGVPYLLVTNEASASVMADAAARATGEVGVFGVVPGPGLTNAMTGIGEALLDSVPIVGIVTDVDRAPGSPDRPGPRPAQRGPAPAGLQGGVRGPPPGPDPRRDPPGLPARPLRASPARSAWSSRSPSAPRSGTTTSRRPRLPAPVRRGGLSAGPSACCRTGRRGSASTPGMGCVDAGPSLAAVAEMLQAPVATSVSGKGCIPDAHPLAVGWGYGTQGTRAAERTFKDVDLVLAVGVRYSEVSTANYAIPEHHRLIHVDANPHILGRNVPASVKVYADARLFLDRLLADAQADPPARRARRSGPQIRQRPRARPRRERHGPDHRRASTRCSSSSSSGAPWARRT